MASRQGASAGGATGVVEPGRIVASKLSAPPLRPGIVDRPRLLDVLLAVPDAPIVLMSAPAGYGKTTLLALWRARDERPFAWVSLDAADNDPVGLIIAVLEALGTVLELDSGLRDALAVPDPPLEEVVLPSLADAWLDCERSFVLVLDDLQLVTNSRCHAAIGYLGERMPPGCQLALATRTEPALPVASLRAHGQLAEVRATELSLQTAEAGAVLSAAGVRLAGDRLERLVERTEGWPAALYLAALSLRGREQPDDFVDRFAGTTRHVADFLTEDVLARQPDDLIDFLLHTCVVEELTGSLCDALTGETDGEATLRELERTNLFLVPLDEERIAYRYHHLFVHYLRAELARRDPALVFELHGRAWRWYREHGLVSRAVTHAQAAGDTDVAADLVAGGWLEMTERGQFATLRNWIAGFDDSEIEAHAPLAVAAAWVTGLAGEGERAARFADAARHGSWSGPMPDGCASLESSLAILSCAFGLGGLSGMRAAGRLVDDVEPVTSQWRPLGLVVYGASLTLEGDFATARRVLDEAVRLAPEGTPIRSFGLSYLALLDLHEGDEERALDHARHAYVIAEQPGLRNYLPSVGAFAVSAHLLSRRGDLDAAAVAVERTYDLMPKLTEAYWWQMIESRILLGPALAALGRTEEAEARLDEAATLLETHRDAGRLHEWRDKAAREVRGRRGRSDELSEAERRVLRLLTGDLSLREIGRELYLSQNTVKTHTRSIYRKLGVSSRAEVRRAATALKGPLNAERDSPG
jgi:LuxR family transcriptional regulator, maltose regulon positive regulatory protein